MPVLFKSYDKNKLKIKVGKFLLDKCAEALKENGEFFMSNMDAKQAWRVKKSLSKKMDRTILTYPAVYEEYEGYLFKLSK